MQTEGRERTEEEFRALLSSAGFEPSSVQFVRTGSYLDAILATKSVV